MHHGKIIAGLLMGAAWGLPTAAQADAGAPMLDTIYSSNMVIQRDAPVRFGGTASPGEKLTVSFNGQTLDLKAGKDGRWLAEFEPVSLGDESLSLSVKGRSGNSARLIDMIAGDVWLCSGQSNMEFPVSRSLNGTGIVAGAKSDRIRLYEVGQSVSAAPQHNFATPGRWQTVTPDSVEDFSAVCYFFAQTLQQTHDVPLGLIDASWGGSQIEAWMSTDALASAGHDAEKLDLLLTYASDPQVGITTMGAEWEGWWAEAVPDEPAPWDSTAETFSQWKQVPQFSSWTEWDDEDIRSHTGLVWFATSVELTQEQAASVDRLSLGGIDEVDVVWVNGRFINTTFGWGSPRSYAIPEDTFKAGENTVVVSVYNSWGAGGMSGPAEDVALVLDDGATVPLAEDWTYDIVTAPVGAPPQAPWTSVNGLAGMFNGMIAPIGNLSLKGAIWYQGESDAGEPETYGDYLSTMIEDWRSHFGEEMSFIVVQLANYGALREGPASSGWAGIREAQRIVTAEDGNGGSVVTIDTGNPRDIHPADKLVVGQRAALVARKIAYGDDVKTGPSPVRAVAEDDGITVSFDNVNEGLMSISGTPVGFEVCNGERCDYVQAEISGTEIHLEGGAEATSVRYCWADSPICNVFDGNSLPATPFEMAIE